jgi:hypothetical protein
MTTRKTKKTKIDEKVACPHTETTKVSKIRLSDKGSPRYATFLNPEKVVHTTRRMDGGLVKNSTAADWMISKTGIGDIVLELKGCDVEKALEQVTATAGYARDNNYLSNKIAGLVLCTQHPGISTKIQRAMQLFAKTFNGPIHVRNRSGEFVFEYVLSFKGPDKA